MGVAFALEIIGQLIEFDELDGLSVVNSFESSIIELMIKVFLDPIITRLYLYGGDLYVLLILWLYRCESFEFLKFIIILATIGVIIQVTLDAINLLK